MGTTRSGFRFVDLHAQGDISPDQQWAADASQVHRAMWFPADGDGISTPTGDQRRYDIAKDLLGYQYLASQTVQTTKGVGLNIGTRRWINRVLPAAYPPVVDDLLNPQNRDWQYAQSIPKCEALTRHSFGADGFLNDGGPRSRDGAKYYVTYRTLPYDIKEDAEVRAATAGGPLSTGGQNGGWTDTNGVLVDAQPDEGDALQRGWRNTRYIIKTEEDRSVLLTMGQGTLEFIVPSDDGKFDITDSGFPFRNTVINVSYEWCLVPIDAIPRVAIANALNCVNHDVFDGYEPETLLFSGYRIVNRRGPFGDWLCNILYGFQFRPNYDFEPRGIIPGVPRLSPAQGWNAWPHVRAKDLHYDQCRARGAALGRGSAYPVAPLPALFRPDQQMNQ